MKLSHFEITEEFVGTRTSLLSVGVKAIWGIDFNHLIAIALQRTDSARRIAAVDTQGHLQLATSAGARQHIEINDMGIAVLYRTSDSRGRVIL